MSGHKTNKMTFASGYKTDEMTLAPGHNTDEMTFAVGQRHPRPVSSLHLPLSWWAISKYFRHASWERLMVFREKMDVSWNWMYTKTFNQWSFGRNEILLNELLAVVHEQDPNMSRFATSGMKWRDEGKTVQWVWNGIWTWESQTKSKRRNT